MAAVLGSSSNDFRWCQNLNEKSDWSWPNSLLAAHPALLWGTGVQGCADTPRRAAEMSPCNANLTHCLKAPGGGHRAVAEQWQTLCPKSHYRYVCANRMTQKSLKILPRMLSTLLLPLTFIFIPLTPGEG